MTRIARLLRAATDTALPVMYGIGDSELDARTPCDEFRVRDLVNHLYQVIVNFQALARREPADFSAAPDVTGADWRSGFAKETERLIESWSDPAALDGVSPGMGLPQLVVGQMALLDLTLHPWDLAVATGQAYRPDEAVVAELHGMVDQMAPMARQMKVFGPEVAVPAGAGDFDRLLAKAGRDPMWTAAAGG